MPKRIAIQIGHISGEEDRLGYRELVSTDGSPYWVEELFDAQAGQLVVLEHTGRCEDLQENADNWRIVCD